MHNPEELARTVVDCGFRLHKDLGPGLLESVYEAILAAMLADLGFQTDRQKPIPIEYNGLALPDAFRADLIIENLLIIEIKSVEQLAPVHGKQLLTYLRLLKQPLGLLLISALRSSGTASSESSTVTRTSRLRVSARTNIPRPGRGSGK